MSNLRSKLIRLAHEHPEYRKDLLPLLAENKVASSGMAVSAVRDFIARLQDLVLDLRDASLGEVDAETQNIGIDFHEVTEAAREMAKQCALIEDHPDVYQDYDTILKALLQVRRING